MQLDHQNDDRICHDAEKLELIHIAEYDTFVDKGYIIKNVEGYNKIKINFVNYIKLDGCHKEQIVSGGNLTDSPTDSIYSGVVSLKGIRLVTFLAELNCL